MATVNFLPKTSPTSYIGFEVKIFCLIHNRFRLLMIMVTLLVKIEAKDGRLS